MASTPTKLLTFAEFEKVPIDPRGWRQELHHGAAITVPPPKHGHLLVQRRLRRSLDPLTGDSWIVETEVGYLPVPEHEYWTADVALVSAERWNRILDSGYLQGPPELVIEVLSPSNTASEMREKRELCLENGAIQFWAVNKDHRTVEVSTLDGHTVTYKSGQQIPLFFAPGKFLLVDEIFA